jgi:hypothetical protein
MSWCLYWSSNRSRGSKQSPFTLPRSPHHQCIPVQVGLQHFARIGTHANFAYTRTPCAIVHVSITHNSAQPCFHNSHDPPAPSAVTGWLHNGELNVGCTVHTKQSRIVHAPPNILPHLHAKLYSYRTQPNPLWSLGTYRGHRAVRHSTPASFNPVNHIRLTPAGTCQQPRVATTPLPW